MIRGVHLAQVTDVHPEEYAVSVYLPYLPPGLLGKGLRVRLGGRMQRPNAGDYYLPRVGDWGLVAFPLEDPRSGVWILSLPDRGFHLVPEELLTQDPDAVLTHHPGGQWTVHHGDGSTEAVWPDGTAVQVIRKDSPRSWLGRLVERFRTRRSSQAWTPPERKPYSPPPGPTAYLYLTHPSGAEVHLAQDGSVRVKTPAGHTLTLDEGEFGAPGELTWRHASGHVVRLTPTGIVVHSAGTLTLTAAGAVVIDGASIAIG